MVTMSSDVRMHVVLVPFPAQGHFAAFLSLAARLHAALPSAAITLVSSPRNVVALRSTSSSSAPFLRFHALPFVPQRSTACPRAPSPPTRSTSATSSRFSSPLSRPRSKPPSTPSWLASAPTLLLPRNKARRSSSSLTPSRRGRLSLHAGVARGMRSSTRAARSAAWCTTRSGTTSRTGSARPEARRRRRRRRSACRTTRRSRSTTVHCSQLPMHLLAADGTDPWSAFHRRQIELGYGTDAVLINTTEELEPPGLRMLRRILGVPVLPIGPLIRLPTQHASHRDSDSDIIMHWLDAHEKMNQSVLYVSFGSQNSLRPDQMMELAAALELTGRQFVWAIRPPVGLGDDDTGTTFGSGKKWLPEGFEERVRANDMGLLVRGWAPQLSILAHASTGAFLSHCGWNSVLESVAHGVPIVGWPLQGDQFFNCEMLAREWGACVEVARGNAEGSSAAVERHRLAEVLETVMGDTAKGAEMRRRVKEIQELIGSAQENGAEALKKMFTSMLRDTDAGMLLPWSADAGAVLGVSVPHAS